ncbi:hypothetical protein Tcan_01123, partial [Toxocara canis]
MDEDEMNPDRISLLIVHKRSLPADDDFRTLHLLRRVIIVCACVRTRMSSPVCFAISNIYLGFNNRALSHSTPPIFPDYVRHLVVFVFVYLSRMLSPSSLSSLFVMKMICVLAIVSENSSDAIRHSQFGECARVLVDW